MKSRDLGAAHPLPGVLRSGLQEDPGQDAPGTHLGDRPVPPLPSPREDLRPRGGQPCGLSFPSPDPGWIKGPGAPRSSGNPAPSSKAARRAGRPGHCGALPGTLIRSMCGTLSSLCGSFRPAHPCSPRAAPGQGPQPSPRNCPPSTRRTETEGLRQKDRARGPSSRGPPPGATGLGSRLGSRVGAGRGLPVLSPVCRRGGDGRTGPPPHPRPAYLGRPHPRRLRSVTRSSRTGSGAAPPAPPPSPPPRLPPPRRPGRLTIKGEAWGRGPGIPAGRKRPLPAPPPARPRPAPPPPRSLCSLDHFSLPLDPGLEGGRPPPLPTLLVLCEPRVVLPLPLPQSPGLVAPPVWPGISQGLKSQVDLD